MPGPAMHHLIAERIVALVQGNELAGGARPIEFGRLQKLLADPRNLPYFFLGAQGPDFLFMDIRSWPPGLRQLGQRYVDVSDFFFNLRKTLKNAVPDRVLQALEAVDDAGAKLVATSSTLSEVEQAFRDLGRLLDGVVQTMKAKAGEFLVEIDFYGQMSHPYRDGLASPSDWALFDALHYRRTGRFAEDLLSSTALDSPLHLYALGYLSHVSADTVGHAYVNLITGGPFRSHAKRHKVGENLQDVLAFGREKGKTDDAPADLSASQLHAFYNFNFTGTINPLEEDDDEPDHDTEMPDALADLIVGSIGRVYGAGFGPPTDRQAIKDAYRLWYRWWRNSTETGGLPKPKAYSFSAEMKEVWERAVDNLGDVGDVMSEAIKKVSGRGVISIIPLLLLYAVTALLAAVAIVDAILGALTTVTVAVFRAAACIVYEHVYDAYQKLRLALALQGYAFPMTQHLDEHYLKQFRDPSIPDPQGVGAATLLPFMPLERIREEFPANLIADEAHLRYPPRDPPSGGAEQPGAIAAPPSYLTREASWYGWGNIPLDPNLVAQLSRPDVPVDEVERLIREGLFLDRSARERPQTLGSATKLTGHLYLRWANRQPIPDFNLDSDRGYGFLCWAQADDPNPDQPAPLGDERPVRIRTI